MHTVLKKDILKRTIDDIAFEGRNKNYGAYVIRKSYEGRLIRSFIYSLIVFFVILLYFERMSRNRADYYYYNSQQGIQVVGVKISKNPFSSLSIERAIKAETSDNTAVPTIVSDDAIVDQNPEDKTNNAGNDSISDNGKGSATDGDANNPGGGIDGEILGSAEVNPQFIGGIKAMQEFIKFNLHYPESARNQNISGVIHIYFVVRSDGSVYDVKVVRGLQPDLDSEAVRVVKSMPLWKPGMQEGIPVNVRCIIPITISPLK